MEKEIDHGVCKSEMIRPVRDSLEVLGGKWKIQIIGALFFGEKRFSELSKDVEGITDRMLSKELRDLETNHMVERRVLSTFPVSVEYSLTDYGKTVRPVIESLRNWGQKHREKVIEEFSG